MTDYVTISRDPFGRASLVCKVIHSDNLQCAWCGKRQHREGRMSLTRVFQYGTVRDDRARVEWDRGYFCSKGCHDSFYGG